MSIKIRGRIIFINRLKLINPNLQELTNNLKVEKTYG